MRSPYGGASLSASRSVGSATTVPVCPSRERACVRGSLLPMSRAASETTSPAEYIMSLFRGTMSIGSKAKAAQELEVKLLKAIEDVEGRGRLVETKHDRKILLDHIHFLYVRTCTDCNRGRDIISLDACKLYEHRQVMYSFHPTVVPRRHVPLFVVDQLEAKFKT